MKKRVQSRKLLVASVGVATVLYACEKKDPYPPGNLVAPPPPDTMVTSGNLVAPPPTLDAAMPLAKDPDAGATQHVTTGNQVAPPPSSPSPKPTNLHPPGNLMPPPPKDPKPTPPKPG